MAEPAGVEHQPLRARGVRDWLLRNASALRIDVEDLVPDRSEVMKTQILPRELEAAGAAWPGLREQHCTMLWTAKEALSKMLRCGMTCPYELLAVKELYAGGGSIWWAV